jgi:Domain of unknown function (DUF6268)
MATFDTSLDTVGKMQVSRSAIAWDVAGELDEKHLLSLTAQYEYSLYDFSGATGLTPGGDVLDGAHQISLTAQYTTILNNKWSWILGGTVSLGFEDGADTSDALIGSGFLVARLQQREDLSWIFGFGVLSRLEDDPLVFPYIGIDWKINDTLRLHSEATSVRFDSTLQDDLILYTSIGWMTREFRLDDSNTVAGGVFQENVWNWALGIESTSQENWRLRFEAGIILAHRIEIFSSTGASVGIADADPVGYLGLQIYRSF